MKRVKEITVVVYFYEIVLEEDIVCFDEMNLEKDVVYYGLGGF